MFPITEIIDSHHHFLDTETNTKFQSFLRKCLNSNNDNNDTIDVSYLPHDYYNDVIITLKEQLNIHVISSVHVECIPDDGYLEAKWIEDMIHENNENRSSVNAIVASCDLGDKDHVEQNLTLLYESCPHVKGIRWILDYNGPYGCNNNNDNNNNDHHYQCVTHIATTRHKKSQEDYLRHCPQQDQDVQGVLQEKKSSSSIILPSFQYGYSLLEKFQYTFDLQCSSEQLMYIYPLIKQYPNIPVVINHIGKPYTFRFDDNNNNIDIMLLKKYDYDIHDFLLNHPIYQQWKNGMNLLSSLSHVYIKLSMFGWTVPDWIHTLRTTNDNDSQSSQQQAEVELQMFEQRMQFIMNTTTMNDDNNTNTNDTNTLKSPSFDIIKIKLLQHIIYDIIDMFTTKRCMIGFNYWKDSTMSDSDGCGTTGPSPTEYILFVYYALHPKYTIQQCQDIFCNNAKQFYRL